MMAMEDLNGSAGCGEVGGCGDVGVLAGDCCDVPERLRFIGLLLLVSGGVAGVSLDTRIDFVDLGGASE